MHWVVIALTMSCLSRARLGTSALNYPDLSAFNRGCKVIGSSELVHTVDALAITGDEGRSSLRKAAGSRQTGFDPQMSEWGNPARKGHPWLNT